MLASTFKHMYKVELIADAVEQDSLNEKNIYIKRTLNDRFMNMIKMALNRNRRQNFIFNTLDLEEYAKRSSKY